MADHTSAEVLSFPTDISTFDNDERISFSKLDSKYIAVQEDGTEFEFDRALKRWIPLADDEADAQIAAAQAAYGGSNAGEESHDFARPGGNGYGNKNKNDGGGGGARQGKKRKQDQAYGREPSDTNGNKQNKRGNSGAADGGNGGNGSGSGSNSNNKRYRLAQAAPKQPKQNTAVYVTGLPADATVDEVAELFSRKCGVIAEEIDSGRPRIKLYMDADGQFKGDALVVFFKPQSVDMAIMLLDDTDFRFGVTTEPRMRVQAADASYKKTNYQTSETENNSEAGSTNAGASAGGAAPTPAAAETGDSQPKADKGKAGGGGGNGSKQDKQKIIKKTQKLDAKLADWSDDERPFSGRNPKWDKIVMLKHMFTLTELAEDPAALLDIKEDIREECAKLGEVTNVVLFDLEPAGVVSVKFKTAGAAAACVQLMDGRAFAGQTVEASLATGREKYRKTKNGSAGDESEDEADDW